MEPVKRKVIKQGSEPIDSSCKDASNQSHREDVKEFAIKNKGNDEHDPCGKTCPQGDHGKRGESLVNGKFSEHRRHSKKYRRTKC